MNHQAMSLIEAALPVLEPGDVPRLALLLHDPEAEIASTQPSTESAESLLALLRVRQTHSKRVGRTIVGLSAVIKRLAGLPATTRVLGYGVTSAHAAGNLYFVETSHRAVGVTLVER